MSRSRRLCVDVWPFVVWHFAIDVAGLLGTNSGSATQTLATVALILVVGTMELCWRDDRAAARVGPGNPPEPVEPRVE